MSKKYCDIFDNNLSKIKKPYKEPVFLYTSGSLRFAAWAGWYSAFGKKELSEQWRFQSFREWSKEIGAGRRYSFLDRHNDDMYKYIPEDVMEKLINDFLKQIKKEIKKGKEKAKQLGMSVVKK